MTSNFKPALEHRKLNRRRPLMKTGDKNPAPVLQNIPINLSNQRLVECGDGRGKLDPPQNGPSRMPTQGEIKKRNLYVSLEPRLEVNRGRKARGWEHS